MAAGMMGMDGCVVALGAGAARARRVSRHVGHGDEVEYNM